MLLGKALEEGIIQDIDEKLSDFYPEFKNKTFGNLVTLKNLAQMEAGLDWDENYNNPFLPNAKAYYGKSLVKGPILKEIQGRTRNQVRIPERFYSASWLCAQKSAESTIGKLFIREILEAFRYGTNCQMEYRRLRYGNNLLSVFILMPEILPSLGNYFWIMEKLVIIKS